MSHLADRLAHRGERRIQPARDVGIVEAGDGQIARHAQATPVCIGQASRRAFIIAREDRGGRLCIATEQLGPRPCIRPAKVKSPGTISPRSSGNFCARSAARYPARRCALAACSGGPCTKPMRRWPSDSRYSVICRAAARSSMKTTGFRAAGGARRDTPRTVRAGRALSPAALHWSSTVARAGFRPGASCCTSSRSCSVATRSRCIESFNGGVVTGFETTLDHAGLQLDHIAGIAARFRPPGAWNTNAIHHDRRARRLRAPRCGTKPRRVMTFCTRARVSSATLADSFSTRDTVISETPACSATWRMVMAARLPRGLARFIPRSSPRWIRAPPAGTRDQWAAKSCVRRAICAMSNRVPA